MLLPYRQNIHKNISPILFLFSLPASRLYYSAFLVLSYFYNYICIE